MGSLNIEYPNIPSGTAEAQLGHIKSYLYQLTEKLNLADFSAEKIFEDVSKAIDAESVAAEGNEKTEKLKEYANLKALIIKTGDYAVRNSPELKKTFESSFGASSEFGTLLQTLTQEISANAEGIKQLFTYTEGINNENGDFGIATQQFVKSGLLYYDSGIPKFGVGVGIISTIADDNGEVIDLAQNRLATFTADEIAFWDQGTKVAYISGNAINFPAANIRGGSIHIGEEENNFFKVDTMGNLTIGDNFEVSNAGIAKFKSEDGNVTLDLSSGKINCKDSNDIDIQMSTDGFVMKYGDSLMGRISPFVTTESGNVLRRQGRMQMGTIEVCANGLADVMGVFDCNGQNNASRLEVVDFRVRDLSGRIRGNYYYSESLDRCRLDANYISVCSTFIDGANTSYKPNIVLENNNYGGKLTLRNGAENESVTKVLASLEATSTGTAFYMGNGADGPWTIAEYDGERHVHADHFHFGNKSDGLIATIFNGIDFSNGITLSFSVSQYSAIVISGWPGSQTGSTKTSIIIPVEVLNTYRGTNKDYSSGSIWQLADDTASIVFYIWRSGTTVYMEHCLGNGHITEIYGIR